MKYKVQIGLEHEIQGTEMHFCNMKYKVQMGFRTLKYKVTNGLSEHWNSCWNPICTLAFMAKPIRTYVFLFWSTVRSWDFNMTIQSEPCISCLMPICTLYFMLEAHLYFKIMFKAHLYLGFYVQEANCTWYNWAVESPSVYCISCSKPMGNLNFMLEAHLYLVWHVNMKYHLYVVFHVQSPSVPSISWNTKVQMGFVHWNTRYWRASEPWNTRYRRAICTLHFMFKAHTVPGILCSMGVRTLKYKVQKPMLYLAFHVQIPIRYLVFHGLWSPSVPCISRYESASEHWNTRYRLAIWTLKYKYRCPSVIMKYKF